MANKTPANPPIGKIKCPLGDCVAEVRQMRNAQTDRKNRYNGAKYVVCPTHGKFGVDARPQTQAWIEENMQPLDEPPPAPPPAPVPKPKRAANDPGHVEKAEGWGFFK